MIDDPPEPSTSNSFFFGESATCRPSSKWQMCPCATIRTMLPRRRPTRMTLHRWRELAMASLILANDICSIGREVGSSECEKEAADDSKSEARLVEVADTLERAISERMRVIRILSHRRRHSSSFVRPRVAPQGLRVLWCEGSVNGLCCSVCSSHSLIDTSCFPCVTSTLTPHHLKSLVLFAFCLDVRLHHACSHTSTSAIHQQHNDVDMVAEQSVDYTRWIVTTLLRAA